MNNPTPGRQYGRFLQHVRLERDLKRLPVNIALLQMKMLISKGKQGLAQGHTTGQKQARSGTQVLDAPAKCLLSSGDNPQLILQSGLASNHITALH